jgi:hypothetical protein
MQPTSDQRIDRLAAGRHGLVTRDEARRCGLSSSQIKRRLACGRLVRVAPSVYRVGGAPVTWRQTALAACLAGPPGTVVSHLTAAALHDLARPPPIPHVTLPPGANGAIGAVMTHRSPLTALDVRTIDGIPSTSMARTLLDCASVVPFRELCDLVDTAFCSRACHPAVIPAMIDRAQDGRGRKGVAALRSAIGVWSPGIAPGSPAEVRLLRRITEAGLEPPERQIDVHDAAGLTIGRIDLGWRRLRAGFEYDSDRHHNPRDWAQDESRQVRYRQAGWDVRRVGKHDLMPSATWLDGHLRGLVRRLAA